MDFTIVSADEPRRGLSPDAGVLNSLTLLEHELTENLLVTRVALLKRTSQDFVAADEDSATAVSEDTFAIPEADQAHTLPHPYASVLNDVPSEIVRKADESASNDAAIDTVLAEFLATGLSVLER